MEFTTLNKIVSLLSEVCGAHAQVSSFYFGEEVDIAASQQEQYPLVWANVLTSNIAEKTLTINMEVMVMDIQRASQENELHTLSDTLSIAQDIYAAMTNPSYQDYYLLSQSVSLEPMREALPDLVNGWRMGLNFEIAQTINRCQIPN